MVPLNFSKGVIPMMEKLAHLLVSDREEIENALAGMTDQEINQLIHRLDVIRGIIKMYQSQKEIQRELDSLFRQLGK